MPTQSTTKGLFAKQWTGVMVQMPRYLLRDGKAIHADIEPQWEVFTYGDAKGRQTHALLTAEAQKQLLNMLPTQLLPLYKRMELALSKAA